MHPTLLNDWEKTPIINEKKILEMEFLLENEYITHIKDGYYYLNTDFSVVETKFYQKLNTNLMKRLGIGDVEKELKALIGKYNRYNRMKDIAEEFCGSLANFRGVSIKEIHTELGMPVEK
ncbi:hypothetical protein PAEPH01_1096 [Pancytospora epiphaga]|nr:hypothetical protein PAEPH01_1096 [Pancytospora epiphaga]